MQPLSGLGIVLRRVRHLEEDVRLTVILRDFGKIIAVSKGGQRMSSKLKAVQEPFSEADFEMSAPPLGVNARLTGGRLKNSHEAIRRSIDAFGVAASVCETIDVLLPYRAPAPDVYDILRQSLQALNSGSLPTREWILFVARLLKILGHGDIMDRATTLAPAQATALAESELERILPWRLKSKDLLS